MKIKEFVKVLMSHIMTTMMYSLKYQDNVVCVSVKHFGNPALPPEPLHPGTLQSLRGYATWEG